MGKTYNEIEYSKDEYGVNQYPQLLANYLCHRYSLKGKLLDVGCGRGFYIIAFRRLELQCVGLDSESVAHFNSIKVDLEHRGFPLVSGFYDVIFSKSTLEHISNTQQVLAECYRVLKPGGRIIILVPDYLSRWKNFYDDPTHIKPFTKKGLKMALELAGFREIECELFTQLPFLWRHKWLRWIPYLVRLLPDITKYRADTQIVLIRHSKERMILATGVK